MVKVSILISSYKRYNFFKRTLYNIVTNPPDIDWELIIADETSDESELLLKELKKYQIKYKFISVNIKEFEEKTGIIKFYNNPSLTNNIGYKYSSGEYIFLQGNEIIVSSQSYNKLLKNWIDDRVEYGIIFSETYDIPHSIIDRIGEYGENLKGVNVSFAHCYPLQKEGEYESLVTNYLSLCNKATWDKIGGYEENLLNGVAVEDSMFVYRVRQIPKSKVIFNDTKVYHQFHGGKTKYYEPNPSTISQERWNEGLEMNRKYYYKEIQSKSFKNPQTWPIGTYGITNIIESGY